MSRIGSISDSSVLIGNKIPYIEISYPKPHILNNISKHSTRLTYTDVLHNGLNYYDEIINISEEKKNNRVLYDKKKELSKTLSASKAVTIDNSDTIITNSASNFNPKQSQKRTGYVFQEPAQPNLFVENAAQNHNKGFVGIDLKGNRGLTDINRKLILIGTTGDEQIYKNSYRNKTIKHKR